MAELTLPQVPSHPRDNLNVPIMLTIGEINILLAVIGLFPLGQVLGFFSKIQSQGNAAIADADRRDMEKAQAEGLKQAQAAEPVPELDGAEAKTLNGAKQYLERPPGPPIIT